MERTCIKGDHAPSCCGCIGPELKDVGDDLSHVRKNFVWEGWAVRYDSIDRPGPDACMGKHGHCRTCGKCMCVTGGTLTERCGDSFLSAAYRWLYQMWQNDRHLPYGCVSFRELFVSLFREADRPAVQAWLEKPDNQSIFQMYRR